MSTNNASNVKYKATKTQPQIRSNQNISDQMR